MEDIEEHEKHASLIKPLWGECAPPLNSLILAGGESRRMGRDKGSIEYHGMAQNDYMFSLLRNFASEVYLSCHPGRVPDTKLPVLKDTFLDLGPYGGVLSAFRFNPNVAWLAVACDIPLLDEKTISYLIDQRDISKVATCFHDTSTDLPEPLITIWEPKAYAVLLQYLGQGISCLRKVLINTDSKQIHTDTPELLRNANTLEESVNMQRILRDGMPG